MRIPISMKIEVDRRRKDADSAYKKFKEIDERLNASSKRSLLKQWLFLRNDWLQKQSEVRTIQDALCTLSIY